MNRFPNKAPSLTRDYNLETIVEVPLEERRVKEHVGHTIPIRHRRYRPKEASVVPDGCILLTQKNAAVLTIKPLTNKRGELLFWK